MCGGQDPSTCDLCGGRGGGGNPLGGGGGVALELRPKGSKGKGGGATQREHTINRSQLINTNSEKG